MSRKTTIQDIARAAGVSHQTVSRVLNKKPDVNSDTRKRIEEVMRQLDYRPSELARGLRSKSTRTIGLIVPDSANPFFAEISKGVENAGFESGYSVVLCNSATKLERELEYLDLLRSKNVDGIIFITTTTHVDHIRPLVDSGIPVVMFYRDGGDLHIDTLKIDNRQAGYMATRHLLDLGHRHIACIMPGSDETPSGQRVLGYRQALDEAGLVVNESLLARGDNVFTGGEQAARDLLASGVPFSALFAANDAMAIGAMRSLREAGRRIPQDISIVGIDDILLANYCEPPLTTVAQMKQEAGILAARMLIERIEERFMGDGRAILLATELVIRRSTTLYTGQ